MVPLKHEKKINGSTICFFFATYIKIFFCKLSIHFYLYNIKHACYYLKTPDCGNYIQSDQMDLFL